MEWIVVTNDAGFTKTVPTDEDDADDNACTNGAQKYCGYSFKLNFTSIISKARAILGLMEMDLTDFFLWYGGFQNVVQIIIKLVLLN